jgi:hypothetical protein
VLKGAEGGGEGDCNACQDSTHWNHSPAEKGKCWGARRKARGAGRGGERAKRSGLPVTRGGHHPSEGCPKSGALPLLVQCMEVGGLDLHGVVRGGGGGM